MTDSKPREARILLVEDNEINQEVATEILKHLGHTCDCVPEGSAAVEAIHQKPYDLVLLDCHMPIMDGFETTFKIRADEQKLDKVFGYAKRIPIVAITASAMKGDRDRCIAAGMDDYLSKPLDPKQVNHVLEKWLPRERGTRSVPAEQPAIEKRRQKEDGRQKTVSRQVTDAFNYDELLARCVGKEDLVIRSIKKFQDRARGDIDEMTQTITTADSAKLHELAHRFKGMAANLAAEPLRELAAALETAGRAGDLSKAQGYIEEMKSELERFNAVVKTMLVPSHAELT